MESMNKGGRWEARSVRRWYDFTANYEVTVITDIDASITLYSTCSIRTGWLNPFVEVLHALFTTSATATILYILFATSQWTIHYY